MIEKDNAEMEARSLSEGNKKCPYCAELVKREAIICKHCKSELKVEVAPVSKPMTQEELEEANQDFKRWLLSSPIAGIGVFFIGVLVLITWGVISGNG